MTEITFYREADDMYYGFECKGHSGYAKQGKDIVCSAISVLTVNFINSVDELTESKCNIIEDSDSAYLKVTIKDYSNSNVQLLFNSLRLGLNGIQEDYSKYLKLTIRRCLP